MIMLHRPYIKRCAPDTNKVTKNRWYDKKPAVYPQLSYKGNKGIKNTPQSSTLPTAPHPEIIASVSCLPI